VNKLWKWIVIGVGAAVAALVSCYLFYVLRRKCKEEGNYLKEIVVWYGIFFHDL